MQKLLMGSVKKRDYEFIYPAICRQNLKTLKWLGLLLFSIMCLLTIITFFPALYMISQNRWVYAGVAIILIPILMMSFCWLPKHHKCILPVLYLLILIMVALSVQIGVITNATERGSTIHVLLFAMPLLIVDYSVRINTMQIVSGMIFCTFSYIYKSEELFALDTVNCFCILAISIVVAVAQQNVRFQDLKNQYIIEQNHKKAIKEKDAQLQENRIAIMMSQIQPHFLYNTLLAIQELCYLDPKQAEQATMEFSKFLRGNVDSLKENRPIPFLKEVEHTKYYLALEKRRFGKKLNVEWNLLSTSFRIPALTLQPIVENAVRYGITKKSTSGVISISSDETQLEYRVEIKDNGRGFDIKKTREDGRTHIGIDNVSSRLYSMCGGSLSITSVENEGTTAVIIIPKGGNSVEYYYDR